MTRASRLITAKEIEAHLLRAIAGQHRLADGQHLSIAFDHEPRPMHIEQGARAEPTMVRLNYEPRSRRFDATMELPAGASSRQAPLRLSGVVHETYEAPVLARAIAQGETIKTSDLVIERRPRADFVPAMVSSSEQAAGLVARRALPAGKVIRQADLMKPELVARNETVTIVFEVPGILLTVRGKALEAGAQGDVINVLNVQSKRTVQATISGPGRVTVTAATPRLATTGDFSTTPRKRTE